MGHDSLSPIAPVQVNVCLVPAGQIQRTRYEAFIARLRKENIVRLGDVSPDKRSNKNLFSPLAFPSGRVILDLSPSDNAPSSIEAFPFELNRNPQIVLGIADGQELRQQIKEDRHDTSKETAFDGIVNDLYDDLYSSLYLYDNHVLSQLLVFDANPMGRQSLKNEHVEYIPSPEMSRTTTVKTIMCDIVALWLGRMEDLAANLQDMNAIDSPQAHQKEQTRQDSLADKVRQRMSTPNLQSQNPASPGPASSRDFASPRLRSPAEQTRPDSQRSPSSIRDGPHTSQSRERMSVQGNNALSPSERRKSQAKGRIRVAMGTMFLQVGRWQDALKELSEAALLVRANSDYLWHGRCLDNMIICILMLGWAGIDFQIPVSSFPASEKAQANKSSQNTPTASSTDISGRPTGSSGKNTASLQTISKLVPDLITFILNLYFKASSFAQEALPPLLIFESIIRYAKLLNVLRVRNGELDRIALQHLVGGSTLEAHNSESLSGGSGYSRNEISSMLFAAIPDTADALTASDTVKILTGLASVLSAIGMQRRMAFILSKLLSIATPALVEARKLGAAEFGIHPAAGLSALVSAQQDLDNIPFSAENVRSGLRTLLNVLRDLYGVVAGDDNPVTGEETEGTPDSQSAPPVGNRSLVARQIDQFGDLGLKIEILGCCLDVCEALPDLGGVLEFSSQLLRIGRRTLFMPKPYETGCAWISQDEQIRLSNNITRTVAAAAKFGLQSVEAEYWDEFLVRGIKMLDLSKNGGLIAHSWLDLDAVEAVETTGRKDPFIFNPFAKTQETAAELVVVAGETVTIRITLQNPLDIDVEIDSIKATADGCNFEAYSQSLYIEPFCVQDVILSGTPHCAGQMRIHGCQVKIKGCRERFFHIISEEVRTQQSTKMKRHGLAARKMASIQPGSADVSQMKSSDKTHAHTIVPEHLAISVLEPQPLLEVRSSSLSQAAIMVLEGETRRFHITLVNISQVPVDLFLVTFQDSATKQIQTAMGSKELPPAEIYEYQLQAKPSLKLVDDDAKGRDIMILPGEPISLVIDVFGRPGLSDALIQIDYACLGIPKSEVKSQFHTRKLLYPITITVNAGVEITRCNLLPFTGNLPPSTQPNDHVKVADESLAYVPSSPKSNSLVPGAYQLGSLLSQLRLGAYSNDHCLLLIDLRNIWPSPLTISIDVRDKVSESSAAGNSARFAQNVHEVLQPGHISRVVLMIPRILISDPYKPIPLLGNQRQYVVSASKTSAEAELANREIFWFRNGLLEHIRGTWKEESTGRCGDIDLRKGMRLTPRMVDCLRIDEIEVYYTVAISDTKSTASISQFSGAGFTVPTNTFTTLHTRVRNNSCEPIFMLLRLQPSVRHQPYTVALDLSKRLVWTGLLQQPLHPALEPGETREVDLGIVALCAGEYEIGATVEEIRRPKLGGARTSVDGQVVGHVTERRLWHARESCVIRAKDDSVL